MQTVEGTLAEFAKRFRPEAARGLRAVYQLNLTGEGGGLWYLTVADQTCQFAPGSAPQPDVTVTMNTQDWEQLVAGQLDAVTAFFQGRIQVQGDLSLAGQLENIFGP
jgi:putative sterol carrier protein